MFEASYIIKCIKYIGDIDHLINSSRTKLGIMPEIPKTYFRVGDFFHHPNLMEANEVKIVAEVIGQSSLSAGIPYEEYPIDKCIIIPTEEQLIMGFRATHFSFRPDLAGKGPEILLDYYIRTMASI